MVFSDPSLSERATMHALIFSIPTTLSENQKRLLQGFQKGEDTALFEFK